MNIFKVIKNKLFIKYNPWVRDNIINPINRKRLKNHDITLLSNNCNGACILHDLGLKFNSPFVNLWLYPKDFIKYCGNIKYYMSKELTFIDKWEGLDYPVGLLDDIKIYFQHYHSEEEAKKKWEERTKRMNLSNLFVLLTDRDGCTKDDMHNLNNLKINHIAILVHKPLPHIPNTYYIKGFENGTQCGILSEWAMIKYPGRKCYDDFNYVKWLNR